MRVFAAEYHRPGLVQTEDQTPDRKRLVMAPPGLSNLDATKSGGSSSSGVPLYAVVGYNGTEAQAGALTDWDLCDGTASTPDLRGKFIIGAIESDATYDLANTGGTAINFTGITSTEGGHTPQNGVGRLTGPTSNPLGTKGNHAHGLTGATDPTMPPSREIVYIQANTAGAKIPAEGVVWLDNTEGTAKFVTFSDLEDRFAMCVTGDGRTQVGLDSRTLNCSTTTDPDHQHPFATNAGFNGSGNQTNGVGGNHVHSDLQDTGITVPKPAFLGLHATKASGNADPISGVVLAYNGIPAELPNSWRLCDGNGSRPDLEARMPLGSGGTFALRETGGQLTSSPLTGVDTISTFGGSHNHFGGASPQTGTGDDHHNFTWTHSHASWSGDIDVMPPWHALYYIIMK